MCCEVLNASVLLVMNQENNNSPWTLLNETWRVAVKKIAPDHTVDADELLQKVPSLFPADAASIEQIDAFNAEFLLQRRA